MDQNLLKRKKHRNPGKYTDKFSIKKTENNISILHACKLLKGFYIEEGIIALILDAEKMNTTIENDDNDITLNEDNYFNKKKNEQIEKNVNNYLQENIKLENTKNNKKINLKRKKKNKLIIKSKDNNNNSIRYQVLTDLSNINIKNIIGVKNFSNDLYVYANCINLDSNIESEYLIEQETFKRKYPYELIDFYESKIIFV